MFNRQHTPATAAAILLRKAVREEARGDYNNAARLRERAARILAA